MAIEITGRHVEVTESIREYARKRLDRVAREFPRVDTIHMILDVQRYLRIAEVIVHARRHIRLEAREESEDMYASIDTVVDKIVKQLRRTVDKKNAHKAHAKPADVEREVEAAGEHD